MGKGKNVAEVSKKAGEMWKSLSADKKKAFEDRAVKAKAEYAAYIAKVKDTDASKAYKEKLAVARKKKLKRSVKSAMRKVKMDASLKRPLSGYMLWFKDTRKSIKGKNIAEVGKKAGEMWKSLPADKKKYSAYVATGKGAAALKAYKEGIAEAKAPLVAKDENLKAKKAAKKAKAKAKAAAKKEKVKALKAKAKAKAVAKKAAKSAQKEKAKAAKAAKTKKAAAAKAAAKAKKAAKVKAKKAAKAKKMEAKKAAKKRQRKLRFLRKRRSPSRRLKS